MDRLNRSELKSLAMHCADGCVSMFMPIHPGHDQVRQDYTRLRNLAARAEEMLRERGIDDPKAVLAPLDGFIDDEESFRQPGRGMALFLEGGTLRAYYTLAPLEEGVFVNGRFHIRPLLAATHDEPFYVVAMSKNRVRLFSGHQGDLFELQVPDLPSGGLDDVPQGDNVYTRTQQHTSGPQRGGSTAMTHHGQRDGDTGQNETMFRLCRATADALRSAMHPSSPAPIVVVADQRLGHELVRTGKIDNVIGQVDGNPDELESHELLARVWPIVEADITRRQREHAERFNEALHHDLGDHDLGSIITAANDGRIEVLFVDPSAARWGRFDPAKRDVVTHPDPELGDDDLVDLAACLTLANGGEVIGKVPGEIEVDAPLAAIYRHRLGQTEVEAPR